MSYVVLAKAGITNVSPSEITGDLGVSPIEATAITGFGLMPDISMTFSTSQQVTGRVYAASYAQPTKSLLAAAVLDMQGAFVKAAARTPDFDVPGSGDVGGLTLGPGVYRWSGALAIPVIVTLDGNATDVWIFQIADTLDIGSFAEVSLTGGALPENVFWQVSGKVGLGVGSHLEGVVLTATSVAMAPGSSLHGRLLAQTAVTLDTNEIVAP